MPFPGLDSIQHISAEKLLRSGLESLGEHVAVIGGGMVGCETAEFIAESGRKVSIIEMQPEILGELFFTVRDALLDRLAKLGVEIHKDSKVKSIEAGRINVVSASGKTSALGPFESVVMALGVRPADPLGPELEERNMRFVKIGDCQSPGNCQHATKMAFEAVRDALV